MWWKSTANILNVWAKLSECIISGFEAKPLYVYIMSHYYLYWITSIDWTIQCKLDAQVDFPLWPAPASDCTHCPCILCPRSGLATVAAALLGSLYPCLDSTCIPPVRVHNRYHSVHMYDIPHTGNFFSLFENSASFWECWRKSTRLLSPQLMLNGRIWWWLSVFEKCGVMMIFRVWRMWCDAALEKLLLFGVAGLAAVWTVVPSVDWRVDNSKHAGWGKSLLLWGSKTYCSIFISKVKYHIETINKIVCLLYKIHLFFIQVCSLTFCFFDLICVMKTTRTS